MGKILVLSIGINSYPKLPEKSQLNYCVNDAKIIHDKYSQFNCEYQNLLLDQNATRTDILKGIADIERKARDEDYVIFNFAGHGFTTASDPQTISSNNSFICPYDFEADYWEQTAINLSTLNVAINQIKANSKLIIFDACHSGGALRRKLPDSKLREIKIDKLIDIIGRNKGTGFLTACDSDEEAQEDEEIQHGVFTHNLINTLEETNSEDYLVPFNEVYKQVLEKVRKATKNEQNPQAKSSDDKFKILTIHKTEPTGKKNIKLDTSIVPTSKIYQPSEYYLPEDLDDFEKKVIQLIQESRFIEIDKLFKESINKIFKKISVPEVSLSAKPDDAIPYYESCREYLKPLLILFNYVLEYSEQKYIVENLEYIFQFESLIHGKSGTTAIIEIPMTLTSEIIFKIMPTAYKKRQLKILKKLINHTINYYGISRPLIYHPRIWHPELFKGSGVSFVKYLFPEENIKNDLTLNCSIKNLNEITFLFDCYSATFDKEYWGSFPTYLIFEDTTTLRRIFSELSNPDYISFIENLFSINIRDFLTLVIKRQKQLLEYRDVSFEIKQSIEEYVAKFEEFISTIPI
ncbi:MAG: caspase family protein [Candidatus Methanoperedens sp.]|nr:caspase family protein [Candidatus Methanoperedens sp.]